LLFITHEAFYLLPESMVIIPGVFRMSDAFFVIFPLFVLTMPRTFSRYKEESMLVISFCLLLLLSCVIGHFSYGQSYTEGLLSVRRSFFWLSFFIIIPLLRDIRDVEKLIKLLTLLVWLYVVALIITKFAPGLGLIHYPKNLYDPFGGMIRFGEYRLFFPYGNMTIMFFFLVLASFIRGETTSWHLAFMVSAAYAIIASLTRGMIFPWLLGTGCAFIFGGSRTVRVIAIVCVILLLTVQVMSGALSGHGMSFIEESSLGKTVLRGGTLGKEAGRMLQARMYLNKFLGSPLAGVGKFAIGKYSKIDDQGGEGTLMAYKKFGIFAGSDLGYLKILAEQGLLGIGWIIWWYSYFWRRLKQTLAKAKALGNIPQVVALCYGIACFTIYLLISGITLPHWVHPNHLTVLPLMLSVMAVVRVRVDELASAARAAAANSLPA